MGVKSLVQGLNAAATAEDRLIRSPIARRRTADWPLRLLIWVRGHRPGAGRPRGKLERKPIQ